MAANGHPVMREHLWMSILPKRTGKPVGIGLKEAILKFVRQAYGAEEAKQCEPICTQLEKNREVIQEFSEIDDVSSLLDPRYRDINATFSDVIKSHILYFKGLDAFREITKGTSSELGVEDLSFDWDHWNPQVDNPISTQHILVELFGVLWNIAAAYSMMACVTQPASCIQGAATGGSDDAYTEVLETLQTRTRYFRSAALVLTYLRQRLVEHGSIYDELDPNVCDVFISLMHAQAQEAVYLGYISMYPGPAQKPDAARMAKVCVMLNWDVYEKISNLSNAKPQNSYNTYAPEVQVHAECIQHAALCWTLMRLEVVKAHLEVSRERSKIPHQTASEVARQIGYHRKNIRIINEYLYDVVKIDRVGPNQRPSPHCRVTVLQAKAGRDERELAALMRRNESVFKKPIPSHEEIDAEFDAIEPDDQTAINSDLEKNKVSEPLSWLINGLPTKGDSPPLPFSHLVSPASVEVWTAVRISVLGQMRIQTETTDRIRKVAADVLTPSPPSTGLVQEDQLPPLLLYFIAHSLGVSGKCLAPHETPLCKELIEPLLKKGLASSLATSIDARIALIGEAESTSLYTSVRNSCRDAASEAASSKHKVVLFNALRGSSVCEDFEFFAKSANTPYNLWREKLPLIRKILSCTSTEEVIKTCAGIHQSMYTLLEDHRRRVVADAVSSPVVQPASAGAPKGAAGGGLWSAFRNSPEDAPDKPQAVFASVLSEQRARMINSGTQERNHGNLLLEYARNVVQMIDEEVIPFEKAESVSVSELQKQFLNRLNSEIQGATTWDRASLIMELTKWMRSSSTDLQAHASLISRRPEVMKEIAPPPAGSITTLTSLGYTRTDLPSRSTDPDAYGGFIGAILTLNAVAKALPVNTKAIRMLNREAETVLRYTNSFVEKMRKLEANLIKSMEQFAVDAQPMYTGTAPSRAPSSRAPSGSRPREQLRQRQGREEAAPLPPQEPPREENVPMLGRRTHNV